MLVVAYFKAGWDSLPSYVIGKDTSLSTFVSVIVVARNEEDCIAQTITCLLAQRYPQQYLEIMVVDDDSTDKTAQIVSSFNSRGVRLLTLRHPTVLNSYKKKALSEGIKMAKGDLIVTTDADCWMGENWLKTIVGVYESGNYQLISSPVAYAKEETWFERLQTLDFAALIAMGGGAMAHKQYITCNGANLAYRKSAFVALNGFDGIDELASGDDELFLHKVARAYPDGVLFLKNRDAIVYTFAKRTLQSFIAQRRRWASKSTQYQQKKQVVLIFTVWLFNVSIWINLLVSFFIPQLFWVFILQISAKILIELYAYGSVLRFFNRCSLWVAIPVFSVLHSAYVALIILMGNAGKYEWKGRLVR